MSRDARPWWLGPAAVLGAWLVRVLGASWRIERVNMSERESRFQAGERCVFACWHARMLPFAFTHRGRGIGVLISQHRDGELIARIIGRLGFTTARGSSTRGGEEGVREMLRLAESGRLLGITPDGPRGPAEQVKPGLVYLASRTGLAVVPIASAASRAWCFRSWDRFRFPWPFARVVVGYGAPIAVPRALGEPDVEVWRARIQGALDDLTRDLGRRAGEPA
jgi:lysophospholipid acyltransferase (LPLAT)-like uncharacterized protein